MAMFINRQNYQEIFLDYYEGRLNEKQKAQIKVFLTENPDLSEEFYNFELISLHPPTIKQDFNFLKKDINSLQNITPNNFEEICVTYLEGDLNNKKLIDQLNNFLKGDIKKQKIFNIYQKTKLKINAHEKLSILDKEKLKHSPTIVINSKLLVRIIAAASLILLFSVYMIYDHTMTKNNHKIKTEHSNSSDAITHVITNNPLQTQHHNNQALPSKNNQHYHRINKQIIEVKEAKQQIIPQKNDPLQPLENKKALLELSSVNQPVLISELNIQLNNLQLFTSNTSKNNSIKKNIITNTLAEKITQWKNQLFNSPSNHNIYAITSLGLEQFNKLVGSDFKVIVDTDSINNRKIIQINAGSLNFYSSISHR